jgi:hypothetical protein
MAVPKMISPDPWEGYARFVPCEEKTIEKDYIIAYFGKMGVILDHSR